MFRGKVVIVDLIPHARILQRETHDCILKWATMHSCTKIGWTACMHMVNMQSSVGDDSEDSVYMENCLISPDEFDEHGLLHIGPYYGKMVYGNLIPDPEEESPMAMIDAFKEFVNDFFETANIPSDMREEVWNMSLRSFCNICNDTAQQAYQDKGISRRQLLTKPQDVICPSCNRKGFMAIVDGFVRCHFCGTVFGDIDNIPD